ncbi:DNA-directed RNA polymerase subunit beta [bacterium]|jgi:DNA-directed RNA polymerase subunit beta|nr:DNA-directed RNA polymerase subunit beta [bacterium]MBT6831892.1 DNA-directed RNA polymerase subunit beta [bacterium]MBT6995982.1 DNA-directed RNA polymerase subunit beta [bacterium]MBT7772257.1 DNA-directed RNA polymerase subunit beta [bacterium]
MAKKTINFPATLKPTLEQNGRYFFSDVGEQFPFPDLTEIQTRSYNWFLENGLKELIDEVNPIVDPTGKKLRLEVLNYEVEEPKYDIETCRKKGLSLESTIRAHVALTNLESGEIKEQDVYFGQIPRITDGGTFIINGVERIIVSQIVRSPGIFFLENSSLPGAYQTKMIPKRGAWLEVETDKRGFVWVKVDRKRKIPVTMFLRAFGYAEDDEILKLFENETKGLEENPILKTLEKDDSTTEKEAWQGVYRRIRPGDLATPENAHAFLEDLFHNFRKYDLGPIARFKINERFGLKTPTDIPGRVFHIEDFVDMVRELLRNNAGKGAGADDIDHLANRRIRAVGELIQNKFRVGMLRTERIIRDRMSIVDLEQVTPTQIVNCRPITAAMHEFFASSQLSQFMDQTNPLAALEHKRRISAMGPGGLSRERAGFDVRDVHPSHYGRICPVTTPEGPNIGLVLHLASYARVNDMGFIETPYRKVLHETKNDGKSAVGHIADKEILDGKKVVAKKDTAIDEKTATALAKIKTLKEIPVRAYISSEVDYYSANEEMKMCVAQANTFLKENGEFEHKQVSARKCFEAGTYHQSVVTHMDVSPQQITSISTSLIAFLEHDDNTRALMGSNMQRQSVPLIKPQAPIIGTGIEEVACGDQCVRAPEAGEIQFSDAKKVTLVGKSGKKYDYKIETFFRTNQSTCILQRPTVESGETVKKGDVLVDGSCVKNGEVSLGQNLLVAYMTWEGYNYEDAVIVSDRIVREGLYNSIHIESYDIDVRDTKLGPEELTADIPNVASAKLKDLDENGIVRIGATTLSGDILAGKVTMKGETELTAEDRLLRAIFGEKAHDVKDSSLRLPRGSGGKVIGVEMLDRSNGDELPTGVLKRVTIFVAQMRHLEAGDKMAGRHGNKGVISKIVPSEDMPYTADGRPIDIILNPLGVSSRMNIGQVLETHLGSAAEKLGIRIATPILNGISNDQIQEFLKTTGLPVSGKEQLFDGKTGEPFDHETVVGINYMLKLIHMVEDKIHARSVGPYSLVTQQPFGGKAQNGGQRFGEMEVWALEAHGAANTLQEMLTIKSDDVKGRGKAYEALVKNEPIELMSLPESFNVLVKELQSLGLKVELHTPDNQVIENPLKITEKETQETETKQIEESSDVEQIAEKTDDMSLSGENEGVEEELAGDKTNETEKIVEETFEDDFEKDVKENEEKKEE